MRFSIITCIILTLASCSSPGRRFGDIEPVRVTVEGSEFDVYVLGETVRVIRMNFQMLPTLALIGPRAVIAIELATGCRVVDGSFQGDQAMADATVFC